MHGPVSAYPIAAPQSQVRYLPDHFALSQNYPNPFNPVTTIAYDLAEATDVRLAIYTLSGQRITTLVSGHQEGGHYEVIWDGRDDVGRSMGSGVYLYRLEALKGGFVSAKRMLLIR